MPNLGGAGGFMSQSVPILVTTETGRQSRAHCEKWEPVFGQNARQANRAHSEKWKPVFGLKCDQKQKPKAPWVKPVSTKAIWRAA
jgi:hypothetical protein